VTDQQPLDSARGGIKAGQRFDLALDIVPVRLRINQQAALLGIDSHHHLALAMIEQMVPIARRDGDTTFRIDIDVIDTPEHRRSYPSLLFG